MSQQQWRRFLPEGRHLVLAAVVALLVLAGVGFASLYQIKAEALSERAAAAAQVQQLQDQNRQLKDTLERAQSEENVEPDARRFFNLGRPGDKVIVAQPPAPAFVPGTSGASVQSGGPPYWRQWLERLFGR